MYGESNDRQLCSETGSQVETEIVRVISLNRTKITEILRFKKKNLRGLDTLKLYNL